VLGLVVTDALYRSHPEMAEGQLAKLRAAVVNMRALAAVARAFDLGDYLYLGRGEVTTGGRDKPSILADTLEAVIGAVYIDSGIEASSALVRRLINPLLRDSAALGAGLDWKTSLQELSAMTGAGAPEYVLTQEGPDHAKTFTAEVRVDGERLGGGQGGSKKQAEQEAAAQAWAVLRKRHPETAG
jgi:ribonuclease-3